MPVTDKNGNWIDGSGNSVNPDHIHPITKRMDKDVERVMKKVLAIEKMMAKQKALVRKIMIAYEKYLERKTKVERTGKGNLTMSNYSNNMRIERDVNDIIEFDDRLQFALDMLKKCAKKWSGDANPALLTLVDEVLQTRKRGKVDKHKLLRLRTYNIKDKDWKKAMKLLDDAMMVQGSKEYMRFKYRDPETGDWKNVKLNFSSL